MNEKTLKALEDSVQKWDLIAHGIITEDSVDCPLCELYLNDAADDCKKCPIYKKTKMESCYNTPYDDINLESSIVLEEDLVKNPNDPPNLNAVEEEIEFLISLLPTDHKLRQL